QPEGKLFDRVHDRSVACTAVVGPADHAACSGVALDMGGQIARAFEDLHDGPQPGWPVFAAAEEAIYEGVALHVHRVERERVDVRIRIVAGPARVLDGLVLREERSLDEEACLCGRPGRLADG